MQSNSKSNPPESKNKKEADVSKTSFTLAEPKTIKFETGLIKRKEFKVLAQFQDCLILYPIKMPQELSNRVVRPGENYLPVIKLSDFYEAKDECKLMKLGSKELTYIIAASPLYYKDKNENLVIENMMCMTSNGELLLLNTKDLNIGVGSVKISNDILPTYFHTQYARFTNQAPVLKIVHLPNTSEVVITGVVQNYSIAGSSYDPKIFFIRYNFETHKRISLFEVPVNRETAIIAAGNFIHAEEASYINANFAYLNPGLICYIEKKDEDCVLNLYDPKNNTITHTPMDKTPIGLTSSRDGRFLLVKTDMDLTLQSELDKRAAHDPEFKNCDARNDYFRLTLYENTSKGLKFITHLKHGIRYHDQPQFMPDGSIIYSPAPGEFIDLNLNQFRSFVMDNVNPQNELQNLIYAYDIKTGRYHTLEDAMIGPESTNYNFRTVNRFVLPNGDVMTERLDAPLPDACYVHITHDSGLEKFLRLDAQMLSSMISQSTAVFGSGQSFPPALGNLISEYVGSDTGNQMTNWILDADEEKRIFDKLDAVMKELKEDDKLDSRLKERFKDCLEHFKSKIKNREHAGLEDCIDKLWNKDGFKDIKKHASDFSLKTKLFGAKNYFKQVVDAVEGTKNLLQPRELKKFQQKK